MNKLYKYAILAVGVAVMPGCTGDFEEMNTDPDNFVSLDEGDLSGLLIGIIGNMITYNDYQVTKGLFCDLYSQYFATNVTYFASDRYTYVSSWEDTMWNIYQQIGVRVVAIKEIAGEDSPEAALADILWVYAFHGFTDYHGPIPYFGSCEGEGVAFNPQDEIYDDFFERLENAVSILKNEASGSTVLADGDYIYGGDVDKWIKFANTLRLRLALRISAVEPEMAKTEAEAAYASGVFESNDDNAIYACDSSNSLFYNYLSRTSMWNEYSMTSTIYSYLKGWSDPRLSIYFQPAASTGEFSSIRNGMPTSDINDRNYTTGAYTSNMGTLWVVYDDDGNISANLDKDFEVMLYPEALFLRAEGALNGWSMGGTAEDLYEEGIRASMEYWGVEESLIDPYISSTAVPAAPGDFYDSEAVCSLQVKWGSSESIQRQQIGTQKWLALYPNGMEAWAEYRRSGYPTMYPIIDSDDSDLPEGTFIQRLNYPEIEYTSDEDNVMGGVELLGGVDSQATPLWWSKAANE